MSGDDLDTGELDQYEHKVAFVFGGEEHPAAGTAARPTARRKATVNGTAAQQHDSVSFFRPLFRGLEKAECVQLRHRLFEEAWRTASQRIETILQDSNRATIDEIKNFVAFASEGSEKIPAGFIITGPSAASDELLFAQLSQELRGDGSVIYVQLQAAEAANLKTAMAKIIRDGTTSILREDLGDPDEEIAVGMDGRKYLSYDLEALHVAATARHVSQVVVALTDCEAFGTGLLSDLISLFYSWRDRIRFTLLFGVATSVEMLQARLPKAMTRLLRGRHFDVVQQSAVLDRIVKSAVAAIDLKLRIGPGLLTALIERLWDQMAGLRSLVDSLKYAYMCHFWANPLSVLLLSDTKALRGILQPEHLESVRSLRSFRNHIDTLVDTRDSQEVLALLEDDKYLFDSLVLQFERREDDHRRMVQTLQLIEASQLVPKSFTRLYQDAIENGVDLGTDDSDFILALKRLQPEELISMSRRLLEAVEAGSPALQLEGWGQEGTNLGETLGQLIDKTEILVERAAANGNLLRSAYSRQSKVLRATVVAQKVQLSQDAAKLSADDKAYTRLIDELIEALRANTGWSAVTSATFHEIWLYDAKTPYRDIFIPKPGHAFKRGLLQSHDYLGCRCCSDADDAGIGPSSTAAAVLYQLYLEAGSYINVADLWASFAAIAGSIDGEGEPDRQALFRFYRGLAELKSMGFVKQSRKKADHVAKMKWL